MKKNLFIIDQFFLNAEDAENMFAGVFNVQVDSQC